MKNHIIFLVTFIIIVNVSFAQMIENSSASPFYFKENTPKTPEVSSLGTYGQFQASPYNGKANINIPLHAIDFDGVQVPINLSYNSSGVRVSQEAGWVGLNWNLSTSFGISRTIYGADDFDNSMSPNAQPSESSISVPDNGYIYNFYEVPPLSTGASVPNVPLSYLHRVFNSFINDPGGTIPSREVDTQPDIFEANIFGNTYKFRLVKKLGSNIIEGRIFNNNNVKIELNLSNMTFTLLDDQGFTYTFSSTERSTTFTPIDGASGFMSSNGPGPYPGFLSELRGDRDKQDEEVITHWYLDSVTSPYGNTLSFTYTDGLSLSFPAPVQSDNYHTGIHTDYITVGTSKNPIGSTTVTKHKYLANITGDFGSIDFELGSRQDLSTLNSVYKFAGYNSLHDADFSLKTNGLEVFPSDPSQSKKLDQIFIKDFSGNTTKTITFNTSYFNSDKLNDNVKERYLRLKLDGVDINERSYNFDYIDSNGLPPKDSKSIDFWGFYNGVNNTTIIPKIGRFMTSQFSSHQVTGQYFLQFNGGIRKSNFNYGKKGLLSKVTYPTKGFTDFSYEPHDVVLPTTPSFNIEEHIVLNGVNQMRWTDMTNENRYNFTYQYLKYANDPSYNYYELAEPELGAPIEVPFSTAQPFTVEFPSTVTATGYLSMVTGLGLPLPNTALYYIENLDTGVKYTLINYQEGPTNFSSSVTINNSILLNPGTYRLRNQYPAGAPVIVLNNQDFTLHTFENANVNLGDFYNRFEIGGARVAKVTNKDSNGNFINAMAYDYEYVEGEDGLKSSGKLMDELIFFSSASNYHSYNPHAYNQQGVTFSSYNTLGNTSSAQGSHIGYSFVQERQLDAQGNALGRVDKLYKNHKNIYFTESWENIPWDNAATAWNYDVKVSNTTVLGLPPRYNFESSNGLLETETIYNSLGEKVQETRNEYQQLTGERDDTYFTKFMPIWQNNAYSFLTYNQYFHYQIPQNFFDQYVLSHTETHQYLQEQEIKTENVKTYDLLTHYPRHIETVLDESESYKNVLFYPYDSEVASLNAMDQLVAENRLFTTIREETYHDSDIVSVKEYGYENSPSITSGHTMATSVSTSKGGAPLEDRMVYEKYDSKGNLLQYKKADDISTVIIWGYNNTQPIAKLEYATYAQVSDYIANLQAKSNADNDRTIDEILSNGTTNYIGNEGNLRQALNNLRNALPNAVVTTYTYDPLIGVTSITDSRGETIYYHYDDFNRLEYVKDAQGKILSKNEYHYKDQ